ncbi:MAG: 50S ribosomal protein L33 [Alphaproteobacteria bacterium]|jgi:large subunit ribosomal protein L33|nr:50S ribosomal protein L33 [Alphaproteobacteria bacterium]
MAKKVKTLIKLESSAGTGYFYVANKNPKNSSEKIVLKKYDPRVRKHVEFKETKLK